MLRRTLAGALAATALVLPLTTAVSAQTAAAAPILATTLTYDDSQAAEFKADVAAGVNVWNSLATNVRIVKAQPGQRVNIRVIADPGWPRATLGPVRPTGTVTVWFGREAVNEGYNKVRIAAHELGHSLGLPDIKPGPCSSLMSGSTGGVSCTNTRPNASELARVDQNYAGTAKSENTETTPTTIISEAAF